ncbi:MAG TPA: cysteine--tRNA ligase [Acidimicrobiales bacterium]|jgi:cysteinyl-tRNA synthetase|nr:cysteine--tRNA ligase [Acidimicrobiales bacterium]
MIRLYDTASATERELELRDRGRLSMYVCGPTVYDHPHVGHGRALLVYDVLRRYLEWSGIEVRHVSNITDIDDKIIARARRDGRGTDEVAAEFEAAWYTAVDALGVLRPHADPHATAYVDDMVDLVARLVDSGHAYVTDEGVWLATDTVPGYGLLARQPLDSLRSGARVGVLASKRSALDFALWKLTPGDEPSWPSPWGPGRPGWHTECVVMSLDLLGEDFDLHAGGADLTFPHHENERAQAVALGRPFSRRWMHHAFVEVAGEKMSKSLGNFTTLTDLLAAHDPRAYRLLVLQSQYRKPMEVTPATLDAATRSLAALDDLARRAAVVPVAPADATAMASFRSRMDDDLDTPGVIADVAQVRRRANALLDAGDDAGAAPLVAAVAEIAGVLGLELRGGATTVGGGGGGAGLPADVAARLVERDGARAGRDWAAADRIRASLEADGWVVEDTPGGTRVHR